MAFPRTEAETITLFKLASARLGWKIASLQTAFPDAVIENGRGQRLVVEFEFDSRNFRQHSHDPAGCDLIVCWRDGWENPSVPVWALEECAGKEAQIIQKILTDFIPKENLSLVHQELRKVSRKNGKLVKELQGTHEEISFLKKQTIYGIAWQILCLLSIAIFIWRIWKY